MLRECRIPGEAAKASGEDDLRVGLLEKIANPAARAVDPVENMQNLKSLSADGAGREALEPEKLGDRSSNRRISALNLYWSL